MIVALLNVSQVTADGTEAVDIYLMEVADSMYRQIQNMPFQFRKSGERLQPFDVLIDLMDNERNLIADAPLVIPPRSAVWLLGEFFGVKKSVVRKVKRATD